MASPLVHTSAIDFNRLFTNSLHYRVPPYQRDYSWTEDNWEDLWADLSALEGTSAQHYMGAIVLQKGEGRHLTIIDGQQRLATLSIFVLAVLDRLRKLVESGVDRDANQERLDLLRDKFIGNKDPSSLRYSSRLALNRNDDPFYQQHIIQFREPINLRKLSTSERRLWEAFRFFRTKLEKHFRASAVGEEIASLLSDTVAHRVIFIQILVQSELSAYTVFETLNARGLELTASDLLKNYLLSKLHPSHTDLDQALDQWSRISELVSAEELPNFLRHSLNASRPYVRRERLFKVVRSDVVTKREDVFPFLDTLESSAHVYRALDEPWDEYWNDFPGCREHVRVLRLFRVTQYKPLVLAAVAAGLSDLHSILRACVVISLRFNVIAKRATHQLEEVYNAAAVAVSKGIAKTTRDVVSRLQPIYVGDEEFVNSFSVATISTDSKNKVVKYILCSIEKQLTPQDLDWETSSVSIEHILPEHPSDGWSSFEGNHGRFVFRMGNMTLLEPSLNRDAGHKAFLEKRQLYAGSRFQLTQRIEADEWSPPHIQRRQEQMAKWASAVWRIDSL